MTTKRRRWADVGESEIGRSLRLRLPLKARGGRLISKVTGGAAAEGYWAEWAPMRPSCRGRLERGRSEALDVGVTGGGADGSEGPADSALIDFGQLENAAGRD